MSLSWDRFALFDWCQIGDPSVMVVANGVDNVAWTDGLTASRTEATLSTTAPDVIAMTAAEDDTEAGQYAEGTYYVYITYKRDATTTYPAMISGASASTSVAIAASGPSDIDLTDIPTSSDAQVDDREVYLLGGNMEKPYYVGVVGDNSTTTYHIDVAEATLQGNKVLAEGTGDYPKKRTLDDALPPMFEFVEVWGNRLWGAIDDTLYFSQPLPNFEDFPSTNSIIISRQAGVGSKITQLRVHKRFLYVFYEDAVYVISGTTRDNFRADRILNKVGCAGGPHSVISRGDTMYWLDRQVGLVSWSGAGKEAHIGVVVEDFWERCDKNRLRRACGSPSPRRHELIWGVTEGRSDRNNRRLVLDELSGQFSVDHGEATAMGLLRNELGELCLLEGTSLGDIFQYDLGDSDGCYSGTQSGTPTTAAGTTLEDTTATFASAGNIEGRPVYGFDSDGELLQDNRVATRTSDTALVLTKPIEGTWATYKIGCIPLIHESGPINLDENGPCLWHHIHCRYIPTTTAATVYIDLQARGDSAYSNACSFDTDGDGHVKMVVFRRGDDMKWRIRSDTVDVRAQIIDVTVFASPTGGF